MSLLKAIYDYFEEYLCVAFLFIMIMCLTIQVVLRAFCGTSLAWTEELSRYTFMWTVYLAAALAAKKTAHVRITAQFALFPPVIRVALRFLGDAIWIFFNIYIAYQGLLVIEESFEFPEISPTLGIIKAWVECIIPASFIMVSWRIAEQYVRRVKEGTLMELATLDGGA